MWLMPRGRPELLFAVLFNTFQMNVTGAQAGLVTKFKNESKFFPFVFPLLSPLLPLPPAFFLHLSSHSLFSVLSFVCFLCPVLLFHEDCGSEVAGVSLCSLSLFRWMFYLQLKLSASRLVAVTGEFPSWL